MIRKFSIWLSVLLLFAASPGYGQSAPEGSKGADDYLYIAADYACFKYTGNVNFAYTEIYYSLLRNQLSFQPEEDGYSALVNMFIEIQSDSGTVVDSSDWNIANWIKSISEAEVPNYMINDAIKAQLAAGKYTVTLRASDVKSGKMGLTKFEINVPHFDSTALCASQIELIYKIASPDGGHFDKAGKKLIPNTRGVYSHDDGVVYFYAEAYNLKDNHDEYSVTAKVLDGNGILYKELPPMTQKVLANSEVILNGLNIAGIKPGVYRLQLVINAGDQTTTTEKAFEVTPGQKEWELARQTQELADFPESENITTEEEAKKFRNEIMFIANSDELKQYDALPLEAKSRFAEAFWKRRDPTPDTPINEYKIEHYDRFRYANEAFSTFRGAGAAENGWRSDRGRVYIVYGPPDDIENHPSSLEELPWAQWFYNDVQGGVYFIFLDESGYGNMRLIHSTAQSEIRDYNWQYRISPSSTGR
jgi:GWxTD domain-containing protein